MKAFVTMGLSLGLVCGTALSQDQKTSAQWIERGKNLLHENCSQCHAIGKDDVGKHPESIAFRDLSARYPVEFLEEALAEGIVTGHPDMPIFNFYPEEVGQIVAYLKTIQAE
ncbi:MAG: cytochrome c [Hyphomicrobiales bacterium]|nr:cytochrome c [Hyphomicrobiales bacterium]MCP4998819.1 cytochrome c [Hyphomicrobiales bacterium]